ncbi:hypothetical protein D3C80_2036300 [compost metagenome]
MATFGRANCITASQAHCQITRAEGIPGGGGINHFLFWQFDRRYVVGFPIGAEHQAGLCPTLNHNLTYAKVAGTAYHLLNRLFTPQ